MRVPRLCKHRASGLAYVTDPDTRREVYLGPWGTAGAEAAYRKWVTEFLARPASRRRPPPRAREQDASGSRGSRGRLTVAGLLEKYLGHCEKVYRKGGRPTSEVGIVRQMAAALLGSCGGALPAAAFTAERLLAVRDALVGRGLARSTINKLLDRARRCWLWAAEGGLVPRGLWHELCEVRPLRRGRAGVREAPPVLPVPWADVEATLPHLAPRWRAAVLLQFHAGMRPGEVVQLRPRELDRSRTPWLYRPARHKKEHEGRPRAVWLGPRAREVLAPLLKGAGPDDWLFPSRQGGHVARSTYYAAVREACDRAGVPGWAPNRLRHARGTDVRRAHGLDAAQGVLGHAHAQTTEVYARADDEAARRAAEETG